jgi:signal transduction histidine kinase
MSMRELSAGPPSASRNGRGLHRLTAALAHTVNNALTGTVGHLELALRQAAPDSEQFNDLQAALACTYRAAAAVRQCVSFATAPSHVHAAPVSLREVANLAAQAARDYAPAGVTIVTAGEEAARVAGQLALLSVAVDQVVHNAVEAMPGGGRLTIEAEEGAARCKLWVRDSGPGLSAAVLEHLFEPFVTTKSFSHLGIGLALASELVQALDGTLTISSGPGIGTTALFSFPTWRATDEERWSNPGSLEPSFTAASDWGEEAASNRIATVV